jgi:Na+/pantothenate symporter
LSIAPWFTLFVGTFIGTFGVQILANDPTPVNPFAVILEQVMLHGWICKVVGVLAFTASLAAIMSTVEADSLIIAISQLVTSDVVYPLKPAATPVQITWIGRSVSLFLTINCGCGHRTLMGRGNLLMHCTDTVWYFVPSMSSVHRGTVCSFS